MEPGHVNWCGAARTEFNRPDTRVSRAYVLPLQYLNAPLVPTLARAEVADAFRTDYFDFWKAIAPLKYRPLELLCYVIEGASERLVARVAKISIVSPLARVFFCIAGQLISFHRCRVRCHKGGRPSQAKMPSSIRPSKSRTCSVPTSVSISDMGVAPLNNCVFPSRTQRTPFAKFPKTSSARAITLAAR